MSKKQKNNKNKLYILKNDKGFKSKILKNQNDKKNFGDLAFNTNLYNNLRSKTLLYKPL